MFIILTPLSFLGTVRKCDVALLEDFVYPGFNVLSSIYHSSTERRAASLTEECRGIVGNGLEEHVI